MLTQRALLLAVCFSAALVASDKHVKHIDDVVSASNDDDDSDDEFLHTQQAEQCGRSVIPQRMSLLEKIIHGTEADKGAWPWHAPLLIMNFIPACGGILVSREWVVTAAHCIQSLNGVQNYTIAMGVSHLSEPNPRAQLRTMKRVVVHPQFQRIRIKKGLNIPMNDVALVQLSSPVEFNNLVQPICLPDNDEHLNNNVHCNIVGFGVTDVNMKMPAASLQEASVTILDNNDCPMIPGNERMFCADGEGSDSCQGDSGGGLYCQGTDERYYLMGVISWGRSCGKMAGYYTRISNYASWIRSIVFSPEM